MYDGFSMKIKYPNVLGKDCCNQEEAKEKIETAWNHAGTEMRYVKRVEG